jgi:hypothetical protein
MAGKAMEAVEVAGPNSDAMVVDGLKQNAKLLTHWKA